MFGVPSANGAYGPWLCETIALPMLRDRLAVSPGPKVMLAERNRGSGLLATTVEDCTNLPSGIELGAHVADRHVLKEDTVRRTCN